MHLNLYRLQLTKLKSAKKLFNAPQLYKMIMNQELPRSQSDHDLFNKYVGDREHYNILLMMQNNESQGEVLLEVLEQNFEEISKLIDRKKRFRNIFQRLINDKQQQSYINLKRDSIPVKVLERTTIDEEFLKMERAKWVKYFANRKLTATERKLAQIRVEKLQSLAGKQKAERRQKILQKRKKTRSMKAIIALYKAPRLTNRLRRAMDQMAANKLNDLSASSQACELIEMKTDKNEEHPLVDGLMESVSWTSCCSECRRMNDSSHETALDRFHRTHEEIKATANYCDYYPS
ncbi:hypothetical protein KR215_011208 [Drosophila sulfurigaster]|nr:hypothetical protein KR215_011208 [Drosophila sulfurigaster]